jgi:hypothetical protein
MHDFDSLNRTLLDAIEALNEIKERTWAPNHLAAEAGLRHAMRLVKRFQDEVAGPSLACSLRGCGPLIDFTPMDKHDQAACLEEYKRTKDPRFMRAHLHLEELDELHDAMSAADEVLVLDALADLMYVVVGTAVTFDLPLPEAFTAVHESNMTKEAQEDDPDRDRVRIKGPGYKAPDLAGVLRDYRVKQVLPHNMQLLQADPIKLRECEFCGMTHADVLGQIREVGRAKCTGMRGRS